MPGSASVLGYANMHIKFMVKSIMNIEEKVQFHYISGLLKNFPYSVTIFYFVMTMILKYEWFLLLKKHYWLFGIISKIKDF